MTDSLAQSLVDAAEAARSAFFGAIVGYIGQVGGNQISFVPEEIKLVVSAEGPSLWEQVARAALAASPASTPAALRQLLFDHADHLMAAAAELYRSAGAIREGRCL